MAPSYSSFRLALASLITPPMQEGKMASAESHDATQSAMVWISAKFGTLVSNVDLVSSSHTSTQSQCSERVLNAASPKALPA